MKLGNYRLLSHQGAGPAGDWHQARKDGTDRLVRVLVCWDEAKASTAWQTAACRLRILAQVNHAGVIPVVELCLEHYPPFAVLAEPRGVSLKAQTKQGGQWPEQTVLEMGRCLADALAEAHRLGLAHGRLTAAQIWIDEIHGLAIDFAGLAESSDSANGSPDPDQAHTVHADLADPMAGPAADILALAQVLRRMVFGPAARASAIRAPSGDAETVTSLPELLDWMSARDPDARPSAAEVVRCIQRLMGDSDHHRRVEATGAGALSQGLTKLPAPGRDGASAPQTPRQLGRYRLVKKLGEGGLGVVHLAEDTANGEVAVETHARPSDQ